MQLRRRDSSREVISRPLRFGAALACALAVWVAGPGHSGGPSDGLVGVSEVQAQSADEASGEKSSGQEASDDDKAPADMSAEDIARRIQKFYKKTEDYQASFKQVYTDLAAGEEKVSWGKVYFKKPGKMRWDYYDSSDYKKRTKTLVKIGRASCRERVYCEV